MGADCVVLYQVGLVPLVEFAVVSGRFFQPEEALLFVGAEAPLNHRVVIGRALMDVEVLQAEFGTLGVKALLELQAIVGLHVVYRKGELLGGVVQGEHSVGLIHFGQDKPHFVTGMDVHSRIKR